MKKYRSAKDILPESLIREIQKYVEGQHLYIPRTERKPWGSGTGIREELRERNNEIIAMYKSGVSIAKLAETFYLSEERIDSIIYDEQSK